VPQASYRTSKAIPLLPVANRSAAPITTIPAGADVRETGPREGPFLPVEYNGVKGWVEHADLKKLN
jgi:hypothetical protein